MIESRVTLREKICYGLGDVCGNGAYTLLSSYLLFYCTDILKISLAATTVVLLAGRLAEALTSVVMGSLLDYFNFKSGKCLPFLKIFLVPMGIWLYLLFASPSFISNHILVWYTGIVFISYSIHFAIVNISYSTLLSVLTRDEDERLSFNLFKNLGANLGGFLVNASTLKLVSVLGKTQKIGFSRAIIVFTILFVCCGLVNAWNQKERVVSVERERINVEQSVRIAIRNKGWLILCGVQFCALTYMAMRTQATAYYAKYILQDEAFGSFLLTVISLVGILMAFIMPTIARQLGTKYCILAGNTLFCITTLINAFGARNHAVALLCSIGFNIGWAVSVGTVFVMVSETIDWSEHQSGKRIDGFMMSVVILTQKLGQTLAGVLTPKVLEWNGYQADGIVTKAVERGILLDYIWLPLGFSIIVILLILFFPKGYRCEQMIKQKT